MSPTEEGANEPPQNTVGPGDWLFGAAESRQVAGDISPSGCTAHDMEILVISEDKVTGKIGKSLILGVQMYFE